MNEESAEVKIKKNRRRIFDAETFVQFNQGQVFVGRSVIEENRALALKSFASDAQGNRELLLKTVGDVLRNRQVMVDMLDPATPEEERFKSSMANKVKIEELGKQAEFNRSMLEINQLMVDVNKLLIEINMRTKETNEGLVEYLDDLSSLNAQWLDGELDSAMKATTSADNDNRISENTAMSTEVSEAAQKNRETITALYERATQNRQTILNESEKSAELREEIVGLREKISANQRRVADKIIEI